MAITPNVSPKKDCWRLVWKESKQVIACFRSSAETQTIHNLFCGTQAECEAQAGLLGLTGLADVLNHGKRPAKPATLTTRGATVTTN